jgi:glycosyltransferase involved in cell wall biosynthesis
LEQVRDYYRIALLDAEVIPNPTWPVPVAERWRLEGCDPKQVLFVGRFDRLKGGDLIIEAFGRVLHDVPEARLCFVGPDASCAVDDGRRWNMEDFVRDRVPGALETGRIKWLGRQPFSALAELRRRAMVTIVCSRSETFSYTAIEAMALGCPTVGAKTGGIAEIIQDNINGLLHRAEDPSDIAAKIVHLLKNPAQAAELGRQAAADCERRYYPDVVAGRTVEFYRRIVSRQALPHQYQRGGGGPRSSLQRKS